MFCNLTFQCLIVHFHYIRTFVGEGVELRHVNNIVDELELDLYKISYWELLDICKNVGYLNIIRIFYLKLWFSFVDGLRKIKDDHSAMKMVGDMVDVGLVDVYIEHGVNEHVLSFLALARTDEVVNDEVVGDEVVHDEVVSCEL
ncbi:hypothetical protein REPUB_Repub06bG0000100 [Reevesia pubescens]